MNSYEKELEDVIRKIPAAERSRTVVAACFRVNREEKVPITHDLMGACPNCGSKKEMEKYLDGWSRDCKDCKMHFAIHFEIGDDESYFTVRK